MKSTVFFARSGCFLPFLIIFNLCFGWLIFKPVTWLLIGLVLILLFLFNLFILTRKILSFGNLRKDVNVVDVEAQVVDEDKNRPMIG